MNDDDRTLRLLAAADAALPPPPARRVTAADLDRALRRQNARRATVMFAALLLAGLAWLQLRAAAAAPENPRMTAPEFAAMQRELAALQQQLRALLEPDCATATAALRARTRATLAVADAVRQRPTGTQGVIARERAH